MENLKENKEVIFATPMKRFYAFMVDFFVVYILKSIYISIFLNIFAKQELMYTHLNVDKAKVDIETFINYDLSTIMITIFITSFFVSSIYNIILISSKWSATIGQKIVGIHIISSDNKKPNMYQIISRSLLIISPWAIIFVALSLIYFTALGSNIVISKTIAVFSTLTFMTWYDLIFFTKEKTMLHDVISKTRVVFSNPEKVKNKNYNNKQSKLAKFFFPDVKGTYNEVKDVISKQKEVIKKEKEKIKNKKKVVEKETIEKTIPEKEGIKKVVKKTTKKPATKKTTAKKPTKKTTKKETGQQ